MSISRIHEVKTGPFHEHSSQLHSIACGVPRWAKVNTGLIKMYEVSCLKLLSVHCVFTDISPGRGTGKASSSAAYTVGWDLGVECFNFHSRSSFDDLAVACNSSTLDGDLNPNSGTYSDFRTDEPTASLRRNRNSSSVDNERDARHTARRYTSSRTAYTRASSGWSFG